MKYFLLSAYAAIIVENVTTFKYTKQKTLENLLIIKGFVWFFVVPPVSLKILDSIEYCNLMCINTYEYALMHTNQ